MAALARSVLGAAGKKRAAARAAAPLGAAAAPLLFATDRPVGVLPTRLSFPAQRLWIRVPAMAAAGEQGKMGAGKTATPSPSRGALLPFARSLSFPAHRVHAAAAAGEEEKVEAGKPATHGRDGAAAPGRKEGKNQADVSRPATEKALDEAVAATNACSCRFEARMVSVVKDSIAKEFSRKALELAGLLDLLFREERASRSKESRSQFNLQLLITILVTITVELTLKLREQKKAKKDKPVKHDAEDEKASGSGAEEEEVGSGSGAEKDGSGTDDTEKEVTGASLPLKNKVACAEVASSINSAEEEELPGTGKEVTGASLPLKKKMACAEVASSINSAAINSAEEEKLPGSGAEAVKGADKV